MNRREEIIDDIDPLLSIMPPRVRERLTDARERERLIEIVLDLGRLPEARFTDREITVSDQEVTRDDIDYVVERIGEFGGDNRAGIERTLHRISAIRNRQGEVVGLTCRIGRAVFGTIDIIGDLLESGHSILLLGKPGVGKTTMLRETARVLAEKKRVIIVDTSNEIAGDGDIPHPAIGRARRMQVPTPELQHEIMIEAVENHTPQVIVIDEIGREEEASAARTIAERGVQLVGTAHGNQLDNLMMNPTLSDLIGGIASVTLSDEEARRRGTQKSVLERKAPPTFDVVIEIADRDTLNVHHDVSTAVDALLRNRGLSAEIRQRTATGQIETRETTFNAGEALQRATGRVQQPPEALRGRDRRGRDREARPEPPAERPPERTTILRGNGRDRSHEEEYVPPTPIVPPDQAERANLRPLRLYPYGLSQNRLKQAGRTLNLPVTVVEELTDADVLLTLRSYYRKRPQVIADAERRGVSVYVLRSNTVSQMENALADIYGLGTPTDPFEDALQEAREAIDEIRRGAGSVELAPQDAYVRRQQHEMARAANLISSSKGKEPQRRVRLHANNYVM